MAARKHQVSGYDIGPEAITRPDMVPGAAPFAEDSLTDFDLDPGITRELAPYPALREPLVPRWSEPTVPDLPLRVSMAAPALPDTRTPLPDTRTPLPETRTPVDTSIPRSGTRHRAISEPPVAATPPAFAARSYPNELWSNEPVFRDRPATLPARSAKPRTPLRTWFFIATTALGAAVLGTNIGNGTLAKLLERHSDSRQTAEPAPSKERTRPHEAWRPLPRAAPPPESSEAPAVRFEDLPLLEHDAPKTLDRQTPRPRPRHPAPAGRRNPYVR